MLNFIPSSLVSIQWVSWFINIITVFAKSIFQWIPDCILQVPRVTQNYSNHHHDEHCQDESEVGGQHALVLLDSSTTPQEREEDNQA